MSYFLSTKRLFAIVLLSLFFVSFSCAPPIAIDTESVLTRSETTLNITIVNAPQNVLLQSTGFLRAVLTPANDFAVITWTSSNPAFLSINSNTGEYVARSSGVVTITATAMVILPTTTSFYTDTVDINVTNASIDVDSIAIDDVLPITVLDTGTFTATVMPPSHTAGAVRWSVAPAEDSTSLIQNILQIDSNTGSFRALDVGGVIVTATIGEGDQEKSDSYIFVIQDPDLLSIEIVDLPTQSLATDSTFTLSTILETTVPTIEYKGLVEWIFSESDVYLVNRPDNKSATFRVLTTQSANISIMAQVASISDIVFLETAGLPFTTLIRSATDIASTVPLSVPNRGFFTIEEVVEDTDINMENIRYVWSFNTDDIEEEDRAELSLDPETGEYHLMREGLFTLVVQKQGSLPSSDTIVTLGENSVQLTVFPNIYVSTFIRNAEDTDPYFPPDVLEDGASFTQSLDYISGVDSQGNANIYYEDGKYKKTIVIGLQSSNGRSTDLLERAVSDSSDLTIHSALQPVEYITDGPRLVSLDSPSNIAQIDLGDPDSTQERRTTFNLDFRLNKAVASSVLPEIVTEHDSFTFLAHPLYFLTGKGKAWEVEVEVFIEFEYFPLSRVFCFEICSAFTSCVNY